MSKRTAPKPPDYAAERLLAVESSVILKRPYVLKVHYLKLAILLVLLTATVASAGGILVGGFPFILEFLRTKGGGKFKFLTREAPTQTSLLHTERVRTLKLRQDRRREVEALDRFLADRRLVNGDPTAVARFLNESNRRYPMSIREGFLDGIEAAAAAEAEKDRVKSAGLLAVLTAAREECLRVEAQRKNASIYVIYQTDREARVAERIASVLNSKGTHAVAVEGVRIPGWPLEVGIRYGYDDRVAATRAMGLIQAVLSMEYGRHRPATMVRRDRERNLMGQAPYHFEVWIPPLEEMGFAPKE